ncbi:SDR family NAD(P)-dependent oxidoreductase [Bordetella petrii]|uniref:SDR family NAD(P)-dependent oxidoreductase n=1 Tax=Bordetella petrii TaxID=94624 RepID=UPI001A972C5F|nr:SDR family NAD(P)-dependent oxidoreductase [Bordetella petrii]MBO1114647.1 SDR family oxidoreductase [Bordetella petrii]
MGKHAVVTGAASGIGADCCRDLFERGYTVFGLDRDEQRLRRMAESAKGASGKFVPIACDASSSASMTRAFEHVSAATAAVDVLVCSAGVFRTGALMELSEADYDALFDINTKGCWLAAKAAYPLLKSAATQDAPARVVFVASAAALRPKTGGGAYAASKVALTYLARVLAVELASQSILVNAVAPATVNTPLVHKLIADAATSGYRVSGVSPLGRVAQPSDVTSVIRFLLGDESRYVTGTVIPVDGGSVAAVLSN